MIINKIPIHKKFKIPIDKDKLEYKKKIIIIISGFIK